jgi:hypothetical protein
MLADIRAKGAAASGAPVAQGGAVGLVKSRRGESPGVDARGGRAAAFTVTDTLCFEFAARSEGALDPCTLGTLASTVTSVRKHLRGPNAKKKLSIGLDLMYNGLSMFRFAQRAIRLYNSTLAAGAAGAAADLSTAARAHRRKAFEDLYASLGERLEPEEQQAIDGLDALVAAIEEKCALRVDASKANIKSGSVFFDDLAEMYRPGTKVISTGVAGSGLCTGLTVLWSKYEQGKAMGQMHRVFVVCVECWISVGRHFMPVVFTDKNYGYVKRRSVSELFFRPLQLQLAGGAGGEQSSAMSVPAISEDAALFATLNARGLSYAQVAAGQHYLQYTTGCFTPFRLGASAAPPSASKNGGRIMMDTEWGSLNHCIARGQHEECRAQINSCHSVYKNWVRDSQNDASRAVEQKLADSSVVKTSSGVLIYKTIPAGLEFACWPLAAGFSFSVKCWGLVVVGEPALSAIPFNDRAFDQLVLPANRKRLIKAVVQYSSPSEGAGARESGEGVYSDIIKGKGEGSVFLFYGPPGVGKTLTAEAIAEMLHKPLFQVSMGDLGTTPAELEKGLKNCLEMSARWDSLVLLDEADIFVEKRSASSGIMRNAMVSVMLKMIEYFQGTLFLTTNRVTTFDPAFQTRITAALRYEALDAAGRTKVWKNLIEASGLSGDLKAAGQGGDVDPDALGKYPLNGRVIKNALRLSLALVISEAREAAAAGGATVAGDGEPQVARRPWRLTQEVIVDTIKMCMEFNSELAVANPF